MSDALSRGTKHVAPLSRIMQAEINDKNPAQIFSDWEARISYEDPRILTHGSTASCVYCDLNTDTIQVFNVGDSRACIITHDDRIYATQDQTTRTEYERILNAGGYVRLSRVCITQDANGEYLVHNKHYPEGMAIPRERVDALLQDSDEVPRCPSLIPSRTFGDYHPDRNGILHKDPGVISQPDQYTFKLSEVKAIVIATDGIWDTISNTDMHQFISHAYASSYTAQDTASYIMQHASDHDNTTAIVVFPNIQF